MYQIGEISNLQELLTAKRQTPGISPCKMFASQAAFHSTPPGVAWQGQQAVSARQDSA